jgi:Phosphoribosylaminoimidazole (AIR) synthetase
MLRLASSVASDVSGWFAMYAPGEYDLAGFCVGIVDNAKLIDGSGIQVGDKIIGIASSGLHSNGYSLARKVLDQSGLAFTDPFPGGDGATVGDVLLTPTTIYVEAVRPLLRDMFKSSKSASRKASRPSRDSTTSSSSCRGIPAGLKQLFFGRALTRLQ